MSNLKLNGIPTGGKIYELQIPKGQNLLDVKRAGENDGLDQVYFEANGHNYVVEGDGLNLSGLKQGVFQTVEFTHGDQSELGTLRAVDDEVNTAWEGVKHLGKASVALLTGGAIGGGILGTKAALQVAPAMREVQAGMGAMKTGFTAVKAGMKPMNAGMELSIGAVQKVIGGSQSKGLISGIFDGAKKVLDLPQRTQEITTGLGMIKSGASTAQSGLNATEQGVAHFDQSMQILKSGSASFKKAGYAVGLGVALAGTVALGGAIYGAARGQQSDRLQAFKGPELP